MDDAVARAHAQPVICDTVTCGIVKSPKWGPLWASPHAIGSVKLWQPAKTEELLSSRNKNIRISFPLDSGNVLLYGAGGRG
jgi:hypothetical protein